MSYTYFCPDEETLPFFGPLLKGRSWDHMAEDGEVLYVGAADETGLPSGVMVVCLHKGSAAQILYLYVLPSKRRSGCMKGMLETITPILKGMKYTKLYMILAKTKEGEVSEELKGFCDACRAEYKLIIGHVVSLPVSLVLKKLPRKSGDCVLTGDISPRVFEGVFMDMDEDIYRRVMYFNREGVPLNLAFDPVSCCALKDDRPEGALLFVPREDRKGVALIYMKGADGRLLLKMLGRSVNEALLRYGEEAFISFSTDNGFGREMGQFFKEYGYWVQAERAVMEL